MTFTRFDATDPKYTKKYLGNLHEMLKKMNDRHALVHLRANILKHERSSSIRIFFDNWVIDFFNQFIKCRNSF